MVRSKVEKFGDDYFYQLGLNLKFCEGIKRFRKTSKMDEFGEGINKIVYDWSKTKCSQEGYEQLVEALEELTKEDGDVMREYFKIWPGIDNRNRYRIEPFFFILWILCAYPSCLKTN